MDEFPPLPTMSMITVRDVSVQQAIRDLDDPDELIINTRYQRGEVGQFKPEFRTRLLESVIRGFPIPPLLIMRKPSGPDEILDGQQRLTTIRAFVEGGFGLTGKHLMMLDPEVFNGKKFNELPDAYRRRIEREYFLKYHIVDESMPPWKVYALINGGMHPLNDQELRKARFAESEHYCLINDLAKTNYWTSFFTKTAPAREKGTELLIKSLISMEFTEVPFTGMQKEWVDFGLNRFMQLYPIPNIFENSILKEHAELLKVLLILFDEKPNSPFRFRNLFTGSISKSKADQITTKSYVFGKLLKNYSSRELIQKKTYLVGVYDYFMTFDENLMLRTTAGSTPTKVMAVNREAYERVSQVMTNNLSSELLGKKVITAKLREKTRLHRTNRLGDIPCRNCGQPASGRFRYEFDVDPDEGGAFEPNNIWIFCEGSY